MRISLPAVVMALSVQGVAWAGGSSLDSIAEFSGVQGQDGWQYGYYTVPGDAASFVELPVFELGQYQDPYPTITVGNWWSYGQPDTYPLLWANGGHPKDRSSYANFDDNWAVRRWTSGAEGTLDLTVTYQRADPFGNVEVSVIVEGQSKWAARTGSTESQKTLHLPVSLGSHVDFTMDALGFQDNDSTRFWASGTVSAVPEPTKAWMLLLSLLCLPAALRLRQ
jgi:hypothetical protein